MTSIKVRKRFELQGMDDQELGRRIGLFREAIDKRNGVILEIGWDRGGRDGSVHRASILYEVPLAAKRSAVAAARAAMGAPWP